MAHKYGKNKRDYTSTSGDPETKPKTVEGSDSASVVGCDDAGFGGGKKYAINQTKGTEHKAPTSGSGR